MLSRYENQAQSGEFGNTDICIRRGFSKFSRSAAVERARPDALAEGVTKI